MGFKIENGVLVKYTEEKGVKDVVIPDGVTEIGDSAFLGCSSLTSVTIPDSVTHIGENAFSRCTALKTVITANASLLMKNSLIKDAIFIMDRGYACEELIRKLYGQTFFLFVYAGAKTAAARILNRT